MYNFELPFVLKGTQDYRYVFEFGYIKVSETVLFVHYPSYLFINSEAGLLSLGIRIIEDPPILQSSSIETHSVSNVFKIADKIISYPEYKSNTLSPEQEVRWKSLISSPLY